MLFDELFALHEFAGRAAAWIVDLPLVRCEHLDQLVDHTALCVFETFTHRCALCVSRAAWKRSVWVAWTAPWLTRG